MASKIVMPQLGESIAEGTIVKWLKKPGDKVEKDENILLISTDKVEAEIPSPADGVLLDIAVEPGETVEVGTVLGSVGEEGEAPKEKESEKKKEKTKEKESDEKKEEEEKEREEDREKDEDIEDDEEEGSEEKENVEKESRKPSSESEDEDEDRSQFYSPLVKKIAQEHKVSEKELSKIKGTGRGKRVSKKDLLQYLESREESQKESTKKETSPLQKEIASSKREVQKPISTMRRVIMENMAASKAKSAHVTTFFEIDYTSIDKVRSKYKDQFKEEEDVSLTYTTFLAAAVCQVLKRHPYINASISKEAITFKKDIHLGIAVAIDDPEPGLMVPVIKNADKQNLRGLAHAINELSYKVRKRKIKPDELSGGTFTITNPGNYGALIGTPIINQPQVAILGVGNIMKKPVVLTVDGSDTIAIRKMGLLGLSFDHRLIDGATADIFMADLKDTLDNWTGTP